jgi:hypothetical protein
VAFLTLNSWTVPVKKGGDFKVIPVGDNTPAFDGTPMRMRHGTYREWGFETTPLVDREAEGLIGMLSGCGEFMPYTEDIYTSKGLYPSGTPVATIAPGQDLQATPATVYDEASGISEAKFGAGSLWPGPATTNVLDADSRDAENVPSGYTAHNGGVLAAENTIRLQGSECLKVTTSGTANSGVRATDVTSGLVGGADYTFATYVYATEALSMRVAINDGTGTTFTTFTTIANAWVRAEVTRTLDASPTRLRCFIFHFATAAGKVFYCDMFQAEQKSYGTAWVDGSRAAPSLDYVDIGGAFESVTVAAWVRAPATERVGANGNIFRMIDAMGNGFTVRRAASTNNIVFVYQKDDGSAGTGSRTYASSPWDDDWHHLACVLYAGNETTYAALYFDGTEVSGASGVTFYPMLQNLTHCYIGNSAGSGPFDGRISETFVLPYALSDNQIAALAGRTAALPKWPRLEADGTFNMQTDYQPEVVESIPGKSGYIGTYDSTTFRANYRQVSFGLRSVKKV